MVRCAVMLPKLGANGRVPLMTVPSARVKTPFSENGPHVALPGATWLSWLTLRQSAGSPGLVGWTTRMLRPWLPT